MNIEYVELELEWNSELSVLDLKKFILSRLIEYGEPIRWAITSLTPHSENTIQKILIEAVLIKNEDKTQNTNTFLS